MIESPQKKEQPMTAQRRGFVCGALLSVLAILVAAACAHQPVKPSWTYSDFKEVPFDPFPGMDFQGKDGNLTADQLKGRVIWNLWSGDNGGFWDYLAAHAFGTSDLLKVVTSPRHRRFEKYGLFNQPGYKRPDGPDQYGLLIDVPRDAKYDFDSKIDLYTYGRSSGIMGLRVFPNPKFDAAAKSKWDAKRYYDDPVYFNDKNLVRPYVVGMACSFCHVGADPTNPPADPNEPEYANLNDYVGQHFFKVWEVFGNDLPENNFVWQLLHSNPAGTLDTAFIATDYLNNPGTMNGIFQVGPRVKIGVPEHVTGGALALRNIHDPQVTPRVLKEGADSVGIEAALSRVYLNIGEYWEEWLAHFNPLIGIKKQSPIKVADAQKLSPHWNWSETHSPALAQYFIAVTKPLKLADAPGGAKYLSDDEKKLRRGKLVFADNCARCHSSKQPPAPINPQSPEGKAWFEAEVVKPDFLTDNFLSADIRVPVTEVKTNATRAVGSNGMRDQIWDNFSSETYKTLPKVGSIQVWDPFTGQSTPWEVPGGGRGYYRPPSLVSVWCCAPFFHNNALGTHVEAVDVDSRMTAFNDAIEKLLWNEKRSGAGSIWRTTAESSLQIPKSYAPWLDSLASDDGYIHIGPIPKGTPINLIANTNLQLGGLGKSYKQVALLARALKALKQVHDESLTGDAATQRLIKLVPDFYALNTCPDFIEDEGHYFGTVLTDLDKRALIEFLKTF
jgi:mono/diheme cytochrome c family protein